MYVGFEKWEIRGLVGDSFGAVNALFSGMALGGVVLAILLQREELQLQRHELEMTRAELKRAAQAQEATEAGIRRQASIMLLSSRLDALNAVAAYHRGQAAEWAAGTPYHI
jgi:hypothetical protein